MITKILLTFYILGSSFNSMGEFHVSQYWENDEHFVSVQKSYVVWYTTNGNGWYNGELYYSANLGSYCADLYVGNTLFPTVLAPSSSIGTVCFDTIGNDLLVGFAVTSYDFGPCIERNVEMCIGNIDL